MPSDIFFNIVYYSAGYYEHFLLFCKYISLVFWKIVFSDNCMSRILLSIIMYCHKSRAKHIKCEIVSLYHNNKDIMEHKEYYNTDTDYMRCYLALHYVDQDGQCGIDLEHMSYILQCNSFLIYYRIKTGLNYSPLQGHLIFKSDNRWESKKVFGSIDAGALFNYFLFHIEM